MSISPALEQVRSQPVHYVRMTLYGVRMTLYGRWNAIKTIKWRHNNVVLGTWDYFPKNLNESTLEEYLRYCSERCSKSVFPDFHNQIIIRGEWRPLSSHLDTSLYVYWLLPHINFFFIRNSFKYWYLKVS